MITFETPNPTLIVP